MSTRDALPVRRALVLGAGLAGLSAARVLAEHVDEVCIVERDRLPDDPQPRVGTPQARHIHNLLLRGLNDLEALFPGFGDALVTRGGVRVDLARDMHFHSIWGWFPRYDSGLQACLASRPLMEQVVRERVRALPNVRWLEQHRAVGLLGDPRRVHGLRCERSGEVGGAVDVEAELVLDASGRGSRLPAWLEALFGTATPFTRVDAKLGYATRLYRRPDTAFDWKMLLVRNPMPSSRAGGILPLEGGRWIVTLAGLAVRRPMRPAFATSRAAWRRRRWPMRWRLPRRWAKRSAIGKPTTCGAITNGCRIGPTAWR
jgi:flavin-dependent dehydrogenase